MVTEEQTIEDGIEPRRADLRMGVTLHSDGDAFKAALYEHIARERLAFSQTDYRQTTRRVTDLDAEPLVATDIKRYQQEAALFVRGLLVYVSIDPNNDQCEVTVHASRFVPGDMQAAVDQVRVWLEPKVEEADDKVSISFRYRACNGRQFDYVRGIEAPTWGDIRENYPALVRSQLDRLFQGFEAGAGGRLVLLHGDPGTGKTYVVRALARAWRDWCNVAYIADPEAFFGNAEYMIQTLVEGVSNDQWRLLIVEDAGELLSRDAKKNTGQGLARLLNVAEGLIGQGLRVLILISTNEDLQALNEAVSRPGRTAAEIEFTEFSAEEANAWLAARGRQDLKVKSPATLAELFAMLSGVRIATQPKREPIGFIRR